VWLRDVRPNDLEAYVRMRCDPAMMAELGGPRPRDEIDAKVQRDVATAESGVGWILMILPDPAEPDTVAGTVVLWSNEDHGEPFSEVGWMVLPEFQGRGVGKAAVRLLLERARDDGRWGEVHAFPAVSNAPSNGICRALGFTLVGAEQVVFAGDVLQSNHWRVDPRTLALRPPSALLNPLE